MIIIQHFVKTTLSPLHTKQNSPAQMVFTFTDGTEFGHFQVLKVTALLVSQVDVRLLS